MKPKAFVIMPFEQGFDKIYEKLIKKPLEEVGYEVNRADDFTDQRNILQTIVVGIAKADLIIAEITILNANVMYELGLCHALKKPTVMLCQSIEGVPFDLRSYKIEIYSTQFDEVDRFTDTLKNIGTEHLNSNITFSNPVSDFWPNDTGTTNNTQVASNKFSNNDEEGGEKTESEDEKGFIDYVVESNEAMTSMTQILMEIGESTETVTLKLAQSTSIIDEINTSGSPDSAVRLRRIINMAASDINDSAVTIEERIPTYEESVNAFISNYDALFAIVPEGVENYRENILPVRENLVFLSEAIRSSMESLRGYRSSIYTMRGISKDLTKSSQRLSKALDKLIENSERIESACARILNIIDERLDS